VSVVLAAALLTGCGKDDVERAAGVSVAEAAERTKAKGTARAEMTMRLTGGGTPALTLKLAGVTALDRPAGRLTVDLAQFADAFELGKPRSGTSSAELLFDGSKLYARLPDYEVLSELSGDKEWIAIDLKPVVSAAGFDAGAWAALLTLDPSKQLEAFAATPTLRLVGQEELAGRKVSHYRGAYRLTDLLRSLSSEQRARVKKDLARMKELVPDLDNPTESDMWIDDDGVIVKTAGDDEIPAADGVPAGTISQTYELSDFGADLDLTPPDEDDVLDYTALAIESAEKFRKTQ